MLIRGFIRRVPPSDGADTWRCRHEHYRPCTEGKTVTDEKAADSRTSSLSDSSFQGFSALTAGHVYQKSLITGRLKRIIGSGPPGRFAELPARAVSRLNKQG
jgi:hypothetical protein